ncbi:sn-glycerol-3-phosphate ABC transporter ATP-binding protein UgpC [Paracoccus sp. 1_MG-2023]|uniref:ABC transporter ATP-binding protein n=1 Tax=unclassified Paracoccus (in: a-proteobacteria) TaxID=2688777 RepID=UPI001C09346C|nr:MULTISPECIES: sn-glycerol-3-phosphate ABC transporter ATP-binding protein UgpC [unclassified Paracoccus (in: a-proteobacteria)]MBU2957845.1 sn-glycerol-3-phosphate ABC transporter ATP-binding protein UgpC [Paracoccus sp. C2R09]MDO6667307.1 sn-glycerol-3-phosphate ABC transporter ATP-binding protein UgpC [Paracoccus sp. 1_MG-2023]
MASVEITGLRKAFGAVEVIHGVDLNIEDGEFVALVGPSGCGKSTLLRIISGLEPATDGEIRIDGRVVNHMNPRERNIAMVFQNYALYPHMTVARNMGFNLKLSGLRRKEIDAKVAEVARLLELDKLLDRKPGQLSGGQRQRVAMGRAIVRDPAAFLFDEPLSNLDAKLRVQMRSEIKTLHQRVRTTSIYVTHDQIEAMTLADRVVILSGGNIEQVGRPIELYDRPRNLFVAGFIGTPSMNMIDATVVPSDTGPMAQLANGQVLRLGPDHRLQAGQAVVLGLRPEHLALGPGGASLPGRITLVEPTGAQTHVTFDMDGISMMAVLEGGLDLQAGSAIEVGIDPDRIHVFDKASGMRA